MFIKRDRRKIEEILADESDTRECLKLSKRPAEFQGTILSLCRESRVHALSNLRVLNLYDNDLTSLQGIGMLSQSPLEEINLGGNKLTSIPLEVRQGAHLGSFDATMRGLLTEDMGNPISPPPAPEKLYLPLKPSLILHHALSL